MQQFCIRFSLLRPAAGMLLPLAVLALIVGPSPAAEPVDAEHAAKMAAGLDLFKSTVRTVLTGRCLLCHGGEKTESEFDLSTREKLLVGGAEGAAIVPG